MPKPKRSSLLAAVPRRVAAGEAGYAGLLGAGEKAVSNRRPTALVACERSGTIRDALIARGIDAWNIDLEGDPGCHHKHLVGDVMELFQDCIRRQQGFDLVIAHPPCTHLARSGAKWFKQKMADGRMQQGIDFFMAFTLLPEALFPRVAIENPVGVMSTRYRKPDQVVHPYHFGDPASKQTCWWLRNLPKLMPTAQEPYDKGQFILTKSGKKMPAWYNLPPGPERAVKRSQTFPGMAEAIADQWGSVLFSKNPCKKR